VGWFLPVPELAREVAADDGAGGRGAESINQRIRNARIDLRTSSPCSLPQGTL